MINDRQYIVVVFGLPGTGKTTFARKLARTLHAAHFNTDMIRSLIGLRSQYQKSDKQKVYQELFDKTRTALRKGKSVVLDGTFYKQSLRDQVIDIADELAIPLKWIQITAAEPVVRKRVSQTRDFSEANFSVYQIIKGVFEPLSETHLVLHSDQEDILEMERLALEYIHG